MKVEVGHHFIRCRANDDDHRGTLEWNGSVKIYEIAEDETLPETREIAEDETSPEIHEIAGSALERAAKLLLILCPQNEMEKHGKSNEVQRQIETETRRTMWDIVEEICRDWKVSPPLETVSTSVNGILGASYDFWDEEEEDGLPDHSCRGAGMGGGHSESAHNVLRGDYPVGPRTTRKVADLHKWGKGLVSGAWSGTRMMRLRTTEPSHSR